MRPRECDGEVCVRFFLFTCFCFLPVFYKAYVGAFEGPVEYRLGFLFFFCDAAMGAAEVCVGVCGLIVVVQ